jgi:hypothetical protein
MPSKMTMNITDDYQVTTQMKTMMNDNKLEEKHLGCHLKVPVPVGPVI